MQPGPTGLGSTALEMLRTRDGEVKAILGSGLNRAEEQLKLQEVLDRSFDYEEHAHRCFQGLWAEMTLDQQKEGLELVTKLLRKSCLSKVHRYESETVSYVSQQSLNGKRSLVQTHVEREGEKWEIGYELVFKNSWWIVDVIIEGASTAEANSAAFLKEARKNGIQSLLQKLRGKVKTDAP